MPELTPAEQRLRARGIGGSEAAIAVGLHPSITPLQLYRHKVAGDPLPIRVPKFNLELGQQLEPVVAWCFERQTGMELRERQDEIRHPEFPFIRGFIDREIVGKPEGFEAKAWNEYARFLWGESGSDDVPMAVLVQCVHYMIASGWRCWHVGALLGGEFRHYTIYWQADIVEMVIDREREFWRRVINHEPPPAMNLDDLRILYERADPGRTVIASEEDMGLWMNMVEAKDQKRAAERRIAKLEFEIKKRMEGAEMLMHHDRPERPIIRWKNQDKRQPDAEALRRDGLYDAYSEEIRSRPLYVLDP